jgi:hypothetical protein
MYTQYHHTIGVYIAPDVLRMTGVADKVVEQDFAHGQVWTGHVIFDD